MTAVTSRALHAHSKGSKVGKGEKIGIVTCPKTRQWRCRDDILEQTVPWTSSSDSKRSVVDAWWRVYGIASEISPHSAYLDNFRDYVTFGSGLCYRKSVCLSFTTFVHPTQGLKLWQYFFVILYLSDRSSDLRAKFYGYHPRGMLPSRVLNARGVAK